MNFAQFKSTIERRCSLEEQYDIIIFLTRQYSNQRLLGFVLGGLLGALIGIVSMSYLSPGV